MMQIRDEVLSGLFFYIFFCANAADVIFSYARNINDRTKIVKKEEWIIMVTEVWKEENSKIRDFL